MDNEKRLINILRKHLHDYGVLINGYADRHSTWLNPNTCEKYYKQMNFCERVIDNAIALMEDEGMVIPQRMIDRYNYYQDKREIVVCGG